MRYISKPNEWFDAGTEVKLIEEWTHPGQERWGLFEGLRDGKPDQETCTFDEFDIVED